MKQHDVDQFFRELDLTLAKPASVILIGGAASLLLGGVRPTRDVDFELKTDGSFDNFVSGIKSVEKKTRIVAQYSEDIDRWSMISLADYRQHTRLYKKFGKVSVKFLEPEYWSIGKIGRYYDSDIEDMIAVFKTQKTKLKNLLFVWKKALKKSPRSEEIFHFKKHAEDFLKTFGPAIWGKETKEIEHILP